MAKPKYLPAFADQYGNLVSAECLHCGQITLYVDGEFPHVVMNEEYEGEDQH
jgi:hypothetical protein